MLIALIVRRIAGNAFAILGPGILLLMPRYWGHSFYNSKDIPLATAFTLISIAAPSIACRILKTDRVIAQAGLFALFGVLVGLASATRLPLAVCLVLLPLLLFVIDGGRKQPRMIIVWGSMFFVSIAAWFLTTVALHPASYEAPFTWLRDAADYFSDHHDEPDVRFAGRDLAASELPRHYGATYLCLTTPIVWLIAAGAGIATAILRWSSHDPIRKGVLTALLFQIFALPVYAFMKHSALYDGVRHFLFVVPPLAAFAAYGIFALHGILKRGIRILLWSLIGLYALTVAAAMRDLHPYEATYFQEAAGGLAGRGKTTKPTTGDSACGKRSNG